MTTVSYDIISQAITQSEKLQETLPEHQKKITLMFFADLRVLLDISERWMNTNEMTIMTLGTLVRYLINMVVTGEGQMIARALEFAKEETKYVVSGLMGGWRK